MPATQEEDGYHGARRDDVRIFRKEEEREFHRTILRVVTSDKLRLCFRKIERLTVRFGKRRYQKEHKADRRADDIPEAVHLRIDNGIEIERSAQHDHTE